METNTAAVSSRFPYRDERLQQHDDQHAVEFEETTPDAEMNLAARTEETQRRLAIPTDGTAENVRAGTTTSATAFARASTAENSPPLLVFNLDSWHTFHIVYHGLSHDEADGLWKASIVHADVRKFEDILGRLHLGFLADTLRECSTEEAIRLLLSDLLSSHTLANSLPPGDSEMSQTSSESWDYRDYSSPSPPSHRCSPEPSLERFVAEYRDVSSGSEPLPRSNCRIVWCSIGR